MVPRSQKPCDSCGKRFSIEHDLSCPKVGLVLARHDDAAKEWVSLGSQVLVPSAITYKTKINSRTVQGERTGAGARQEGRESNGGVDTVESDQGGRARTVNRAAALGMEVEEDRDSEGEEGGEGTQRALGALEFLTQDAEPSGSAP